MCLGGLSGGHAFHDVGLGPHVEHAYHMLALNEQRGYFGPTLRDDTDRKRKIGDFEQCWMAGDHSNIGGSWEDQQLADIALAWMMSRFHALGVKFDDSYLYRETVKFKDYINAEVAKKSYLAEMNPRQWGEGRVPTWQ